MSRPPLPPPPSPRSLFQRVAGATPRTLGPPSRGLEVDVAIVGAGVTGCAAARALARGGVDVAVFEARDVAAGASGRNGGFLLAGLARRHELLVAATSRTRARELHAFSCEWRDRLVATAAEVGAPEAARRTGSLRLAVDEEELAALDREHGLLAADGFAVERLEARDLPDGLGDRFVGGLRMPDDGASLPAAWVRALAADAIAAGARVHEGAPVLAIEPRGEAGREGVALDVAGARVQAGVVVVATEAWLPALVPSLAGRVLPYRSQVLAAAPPVDAGGRVRRVLSHPTWSRRGWDYAQQLADGHLVVGGERVEQVGPLRGWDEVVRDEDQRWLEQWIAEVLDVRANVRARWAGVLAQTDDEWPYVGQVPGMPGVVACGGWGGAGNVLGFACGTLVGEGLTRCALAAEAATDAVPAEFDAARLAMG